MGQEGLDSLETAISSNSSVGKAATPAGGSGPVLASSPEDVTPSKAPGTKAWRRPGDWNRSAHGREEPGASASGTRVGRDQLKGATEARPKQASGDGDDKGAPRLPQVLGVKSGQPGVRRQKGPGAQGGQRPRRLALSSPTVSGSASTCCTNRF